MGSTYKTFQSLAYDSLDWGVQKGKEYNKKYNKPTSENLHIGYNHLDNLINKLKREQEVKHLLDNYYFEDDEF